MQDENAGQRGGGKGKGGGGGGVLRLGGGCFVSPAGRWRRLLHPAPAPPASCATAPAAPPAPPAAPAGPPAPPPPPACRLAPPARPQPPPRPPAAPSPTLPSRAAPRPPRPVRRRGSRSRVAAEPWRDRGSVHYIQPGSVRCAQGVGVGVGVGAPSSGDTHAAESKTLENNAEPDTQDRHAIQTRNSDAQLRHATGQ
jgi:hypothetical protein